MKTSKILVSVFALTLFCTSCSEISQEELTIADYERAEFFLGGSDDMVVTGLVSNISWQDDGSLIYAISTSEGKEYLSVDLSNGEKVSIFDQAKLIQSLSEYSKDEIDPANLNLTNIQKADGQIDFTYAGAEYSTDLSSYSTQNKGRSLGFSFTEIYSPDKSKAAYIMNHNLFVRDIATNKTTQLTFDGEEDYGYGTNNAGWTQRSSPVLLWSPNSDKIATFRHDGRGVGEMYLYNTKVGHSDLQKWKYPLPGDSLIFRIERIVIDLSARSPKIVKLKMPQDPHRSTTSDHIAGGGGRFLDVAWNEDASVLSFVSSSRDHKVAHLKVADPKTGAVRSVLREESPTYYEGGYSDENWRTLTASNEVIWFSEKSDWGHLYLHDLNTGELKNAITSGNWAVLDVRYVDEENRQVYFTGSNKEEGDPYYQYLYRVNFDGSGFSLITPENAHHTVSFSDDMQYIIDTYSTPVTAPITKVRDMNGQEIITLGEGDLSGIIEKGWIAPNPFTVKARDGETDLFGLMYKPSNFDPTKKYPILNYLYPGPQSGSVGSRSFRIARSDKQAVAELGFVVVELDAMGTPGRSKSFHDAYYGDMGDNGLPDQKGGIEQLAADNPWMDIDRVGIWGHSGGGFASTGGILRYPDFYKVAVSSSGNHDNRNYEDDWGEKWHGLLVEEFDVETTGKSQMDNYDKQANQLLAANLKGKLLLAHGLLDDNVPPTNTLLVAEELMKANKEFDMLLLPNARHGYGVHSRYFMKKRWNYFVEHLQGRTPIYDFEFKD